MKNILVYVFLLLSTLTVSNATGWCDNGCAKEVKDYAQLSQEIYDNKLKVGNWNRIKDFNQEFSNLKFGLHLSVYKNNKTNKYVIALEGTGKTDIDDIITDAIQLINAVDTPRQYTLAREYVEQLIQDNSYYKNAIFTGHSLGGGIALYLAKSFRMKAYTFNPAGLSDDTISDANVFAYNKGLSTQKENVLNIISHLYHYTTHKTPKYGKPSKKIVQIVTTR